MCGPVLWVDFVGETAGQFGRKQKPLRGLAALALDHFRSGHLIPGVVEFGNRKSPGIQRQHAARLCAGRIKAGINPLRIGEAAGADQQTAIAGFGLFFCVYSHNMFRVKCWSLV